MCSTANTLRYDETAPPSPVNFYGRTKVEAEEAVNTLGDQQSSHAAIVVGLPLMGRR